MRAQDIIDVQTLENQAFALVARLHVMLRRERGRIIDVEYMNRDASYCRHILDLTGIEGSDELDALCIKLEALYFGPHGIFIRKAGPPPARPQPPAMVPEPKPAPRQEVRDKYIGRLR